jgi:hypothetical protein
LDALHPDGTVTHLPASAQVLTTLRGTVIGYGGQQQLLALRDGRWQSFSAAQPPGRPGHGGDGGPVGLAAVADARAAAADGAGNLYIAEPFAVRRISPTGIISTVAGTDRDDPPRAWEWGGRGSAGQDFPQLPVPERPSVATRTPMPFIAAMTVSTDGTIWIINLGTIYRIRRGTFEKILDLPSAPRTTTDPRSGASYSPYGLVALPGNDGVIAYDAAKRSIYLVDAEAHLVKTVVHAPLAGGSVSFVQPMGVTEQGTVLICLGGYGLFALKP